MSEYGHALINQLDAEDLALLDERMTERRRRLGLDAPAPVEVQQNEPLLSPAQAAERAGLHVETVRRAARSGALKAAKAGRSVRIAPDDLDAWLAVSPEPNAAPAPRRRRPRAIRQPLADALASMDTTRAGA